MRQIDRKSFKIQTTSIPAPVGGLNARDALANMDPMDAVKMDNIFPTPSYVQLRSGYIQWATGLPAWVETVMKYNSTTTSKLFAASSAGIYDVTNKGAVGPAVVSGLTSARWQHLNFTLSAAGSYLYAVNGSDKPLLYNGSTWTPIDGTSTPAITGVTTTNLIHVHLFKNRLWFVEKNSFRVWYLPVSSIGGAAESIDFGPLFQLGGYLMAMASWSIDNAGGVDDYAAFISSEGEVALYRGNDPTTASSWSLVGLFRTGRPTGRRCFTRLGSDVIMICADGFVLLSKLLLTDRSQNQTISNKIQNLVNNDVQQYANNFGWECIVYPTGNKLIINVPQTTNNTQYQYVMNTITGAWCRFTNWNAACFEILTDKLYFGGNTYVAQCDTGYNDGGNQISGDVEQAYSYFGVPGREKRFTLVRPILNSDGNISPAVALNIDFQNQTPTTTATFTGTGGSAWNVSPWDISPWGGLNNTLKNWQTVTGVGFAASLHMLLAAQYFGIKWQSTDFVYEPGGVL